MPGARRGGRRGSLAGGSTIMHTDASTPSLLRFCCRTPVFRDTGHLVGPSSWGSRDWNKVAKLHRSKLKFGASRILLRPTTPVSASNRSMEALASHMMSTRDPAPGDLDSHVKPFQNFVLGRKCHIMASRSMRASAMTRQARMSSPHAIEWSTRGMVR